ncbi:GPI-anchored protein LLG2-like isoform X1 [Chenopodium quinoa]|uniref:GPI-anchored protein LLG2-like isoform X1 n=1 Tax=Chenopodium quinoa TaxID=63459 RepID=UPI000B7736D1|nr:GPI-anchored protein LLG2-like isoform X1 [Chenopodium quinoa]
MSMATEKRIRSSHEMIKFCHSSTTGIAAATSVTIMILLLLLHIASANPSDELQQPRFSVGRHLLQATKDCPLDVQHLNYTIIISRCKGPRYPANICCGAFKELACPYAPTLNDVTNNCATTLFSYINLYGKYPPGLFANICRDSKRGLECTDAQMSMSKPKSSCHTATISIFFLSIFYWMLL